MVFLEASCILPLIGLNLHLVRPTLQHEYYGPCDEKTCLRGVQQSEFQTSHLSYRD